MNCLRVSWRRNIYHSINFVIVIVVVIVVVVVVVVVCCSVERKEYTLTYHSNLPTYHLPPTTFPGQFAQGVRPVRRWM